MGSTDPGFPPGTGPCCNSVYDTLIRYDDKYQPTPQLAESWELSNGGKTLTMKLRRA